MLQKWREKTSVIRPSAVLNYIMGKDWAAQASLQLSSHIVNA